MFFIKEILNVIVNPVAETRVSSYRAVERHQILSKHKEHIEKFGVFIFNFELKRHVVFPHEAIRVLDFFSPRVDAFPHITSGRRPRVIRKCINKW